MRFQLLLLLPVVGGCLFAISATVAVAVFLRRVGQHTKGSAEFLPRISLLKPVYGMEKDLDMNLRSACTQDYPEYQVVFSVQHLDDPALPLLRELEREFGAERVSIVALEDEPVVNGKVQNLINALAAARYEYLVISDSDVLLQPDYLRAIIAPLSDSEVGYVCTLYRGSRAESWFERLELLTYNTDFIPSVVFAYLSGASGFCLGPSIALQRSTLAAIGGFEALADYLVEDYELGRRIRASGRKMVLAGQIVDLVVDLNSVGEWLQHQLYWDQNTWAAQPGGFIATIFTKCIPFALLYAVVSGFDPPSLAIFLVTIGVRAGTATVTLWLLQERVSKYEILLVPVRDIVALFTWLAAITKRRVVWRGNEFTLTRRGRIVPRVL